MSENTEKNTIDLKGTVERIEKIEKVRAVVTQKENEVETHQHDLENVETIKGVNSPEYNLKKTILETTTKELEDAKKELEGLVYKKSELKPTFDYIVKKFEDELRAEQEREFHVEIGVKNENGVSTGKKAFKQLLEYLNHDVTWTAKTAPSLMLLVRNMEENKPWVQSEEFDNVILLRSANVLSLWKYILEEMEGKGYYEAKKFLECWMNCGKSISETVREIQKLHEDTRKLGAQLNTIEEEYDRSFDDLPEEEKVTTKEEVDPDVD